MNVAIKSVGVRDLKDNLSRYLETVRKGGEVVVTEHGHPIARVIPIHGTASHERLAALMAAGDVSRARRPSRTVPRPKRLPGGATISDLVRDQGR
jgi:prevent-host-death family protein